MIYQDYFIHSEFEDVWHTLQTYYRELDGVKKLYKTLFYTIRNLPIDESRASKPLKMYYDFEQMIHVEGAPDPIEWLIGREVIFNREGNLIDCSDDTVASEMPDVAVMAAHLLYWSTLYDFRTQTRYHKDCLKSCEARMNGVTKYELPDEALGLSHKRKQAYYWKAAAANDSAIDWSYILEMMRKRIEFHIGYHRFTDRFVNSRHYVSQMELCCRLLKLAEADYYDDIEKIYVNTRNASRFVGEIFSQYDYEALYRDKEFIDVKLSDLRRAKAFKLLWKFLEHNLTHWWD